MTSEVLARLHSRAMTSPGAWTAHDFDALLAAPGAFLVPHFLSLSPHITGRAQTFGTSSPSATARPEQDLAGFALGRVILDEAELLTLVVNPDAQRQGIGQTCLAGFEAEARIRGAKNAFLEVADNNPAACALYLGAGWHETGRRHGYYRAPNGRVDARLMRKRLTPD